MTTKRMHDYVYIIKDGDRYKIGYSGDPERRLKSLQTGNPRKLELVFRFKTLWAEPLEYYLQDHFKSKQTRGEWYALTDKELNEMPEVIEKIRRARATEESENLVDCILVYMEALKSVAEKKVKKEDLTLERPIDEMTINELIDIASSN